VLTLAADTRFCRPSYTNDQIWEIDMGGNEPPAFSIQTTLGLRARWLRLFPRFRSNEVTLSDPSKFCQPPCLQTFYPNYLAFQTSPLIGIDVFIEYWVPESQVITGRIHVTNRSVLTEHLEMEWVGQLSPLGTGESMVTVPMGSNFVLQGKTGGVVPICLITGGAQPATGPYPALTLEMDLFPGNTRQFVWALAAMTDAQASLDLARRTTLRPWDAEIARLDMYNNSQMIEIRTGNPEWDATLALTQKVAYSLFLPGNRFLPYSSFVLSRQPDQGNSIRGDGSDYSYLWSGQTVLDAYYLSSLILPGGIDLVEGILRNFLSVQEANGFIDWKPGLGGQRTRHLAQPLLATLTWQIDQYRTDHSWLHEIYPSLLRFIRFWFSPEHDKDGDGFPEWDHPLQTGLEDAPIYNRWSPQAQGVDISCLESPALAAMLFRECDSLIKIAHRIQFEEDLPWLIAHVDSLLKNLETTWDQRTHNYRYRDFETHIISSGVKVASFDWDGHLSIKRSLKPAQRLLIRLKCKNEKNSPVSITLFGEGLNGEIIEQIPSGRLAWSGGNATYTTQNKFLKIKKVDIQGISKGDEGIISTIDFTDEDLSLFLPLWAGIPDRKRGQEIVSRNLVPRYLKPLGLIISSENPENDESSYLNQVLLPWVQFIGEGLLEYNGRPIVADLLTGIMNSLSNILKQNKAFRESYSAENGQPVGERNPLRGLAPFGLFLKTLGIQKITPQEIILDGINPFPGPVTVKYQGITISCHSKDTMVSFPSGPTTSVKGPGPHKISLS